MASQYSDNEHGTAFMVEEKHALCDWLARAGITVEGDLVTRVVIDLQLDELARVYVEKIGDRRMLEVVPPSLAGARVMFAGEDGEAGPGAETGEPEMS